MANGKAEAPQIASTPAFWRFSARASSLSDHAMQCERGAAAERKACGRMKATARRLGESKSFIS
jgi:hypothetical protein